MILDGCEYPEDLLYDVEAGTWARNEGDVFRIGVAQQLSWLSGFFTSVTFKSVGQFVQAGRGLGSVEGPRHFDIVRAPFDCTIVEANSKLLAQPRLINKRPYGEGWFALVRQVGATSSLRPFAEISDSIALNLKRMGVHCFREFPDFEMYEIGTECAAVLVRLDELLKKSEVGTVVHIVSDDPTADVELQAWGDRTGAEILESRKDGTIQHFIVKKG